MAIRDKRAEKLIFIHWQGLSVMWKSSFGSLNTWIAETFRLLHFSFIHMLFLTANSISIFRLLFVSQVKREFKGRKVISIFASVVTNLWSWSWQIIHSRCCSERFDYWCPLYNKLLQHHHPKRCFKSLSSLSILIYEKLPRSWSEQQSGLISNTSTNCQRRQFIEKTILHPDHHHSHQPCPHIHSHPLVSKLQTLPSNQYCRKIPVQLSGKFSQLQKTLSRFCISKSLWNF